MGRYFLWGALVAALIAIAVAALLERGMRSGGGGGAVRAELPVLGVVPDFELTNRDGRTVRRADLLGRPWIADFIFTRCQVSCPIITGRLADVQSRLPDSETPLVSFSVDPAHDTPEVLQAFAEEWGAEDRWLFLTGSTEEIYDLVRSGFKLGLDPPDELADVNPDEPIAHSTKLVLVDAEGRIRGYYNGMTPDGADQLLQDLPQLLAR
ncbi:MAG: SCO family protein [Acidobacteria bacterium]|nr:SCO family protein [Acidobacteriota bacterium]